MTNFTETLRDINDRLELPQPARSRVLLEIAADLDDLFAYYRQHGCSPQEARIRAIEHCDLSDEALAGLVQVHTSVWKRFLDRFGAQAQSRWERVFLLVLLAFVALLTGRMIVTLEVFEAAEAWVWPVVLVTFAAAVFGGHKLYLAFLKKDHDSRRLRSGLTALIAAAVANLIIGTFGAWMGLYRAAGRAADDVAGFWRYAVEWLFAGSSLFVVSLTAAVMVSLLWFVLANKVARIEEAEAAILLAGTRE